MDKLELENTIFEIAFERLKKIYGPFEKVVEQKDRPDAAIKLVNTHVIGIEITSTDRKKDKQYFNDVKHSRNISNKQIDDYINEGIVHEEPLKLASIPFPHDYIFNGIKSKADKFADYNVNGTYKEVILLVTSEFLTPKYEYFHDYLIPWTKYLLSSIDYPFRKVIFVSSEGPECIVIYDSKKKTKYKPNIDEGKEVGVTSLQSSFIPIGKGINIKNIFNQEPIIKRKKKR
ncbi:hypothetical protein SJU70_00520 [Aeromonas caviae]|uniref:hypothetical protein n=1 Tax=Aeromonas caviae TaxID=648 RepID=UPI0029D82B7B|nr:hypothetical protein [Aeromonas caviae]MDX7889752.1 hypothetical protein [Aeromonas caviae]